MGDHEPRLIHLNASQKQNVQIERARTVGYRCGPVAAELLLDPEQGIEQRPGLQVRFQSHNGVYKTRLLCETHRFGTVERRSMRDAPQRFKPFGSGRQRSLGRSGPAGQVGAHSDVGRAHLL